MKKSILAAAAVFCGLFAGASAPAHATDPLCTNTPNLNMVKCPENSTDWYESYEDIIDTLDAVGSSVTASTNSFQTQLNAVGVSTTAIALSTRTLAIAVGASTASLQTQLNSVGVSTTNIAASTTTLGTQKLDAATFGVYGGTITSALATKLDAATFGIYGGTVTTALGTKLDAATFGVYSGTVTTAIGTKLDSVTFGVYSGTVTTAFAAKASSGINADITQLKGLTTGIPAGNIDLSTVTTALATKLDAATFGIYGGTVTTAFAAKASSGINADVTQLKGLTVGIPQDMVNLSTVTTALALKTDNTTFGAYGATVSAAITANAAAIATVNWVATHLSTAQFSSGFNAANQLVQLDGTARLPAVDGSQLTGISGALAGGASGHVGYWTSATTLDNTDTTWSSTGTSFDKSVKVNAPVHISTNPAPFVPSLFIGTALSSPTIEKGIVVITTTNAGPNKSDTVIAIGGMMTDDGFSSSKLLAYKKYNSGSGQSTPTMSILVASGTMTNPAPTPANFLIYRTETLALDSNGTERRTAFMDFNIDTSTGYVAGNLPTRITWGTQDRISTDPSNRMVLTASGTLNIGVANNSQIATRLDVADTSGSSPVFKMAGANSSIFQMNSAGDLSLTGRTWVGTFTVTGAPRQVTVTPASGGDYPYTGLLKFGRDNTYTAYMSHDGYNLNIENPYNDTAPTYGSIYFRTRTSVAASSTMVWTGQGRLGIQQPTPTATVHIAGADATPFQVGASTFIVDSNGRVGFNESSALDWLVTMKATAATSMRLLRIYAPGRADTVQVNGYNGQGDRSSTATLVVGDPFYGTDLVNDYKIDLRSKSLAVLGYADNGIAAYGDRLSLLSVIGASAGGGNPTGRLFEVMGATAGTTAGTYADIMFGRSRGDIIIGKGGVGNNYGKLAINPTSLTDAQTNPFTINGATFTVTDAGVVSAPSQPGARACLITDKTFGGGATNAVFWSTASSSYDFGLYNRNGVADIAASSSLFTMRGAGVYNVAFCVNLTATSSTNLQVSVTDQSSQYVPFSGVYPSQGTFTERMYCGSGSMEMNDGNSLRLVIYNDVATTVEGGCRQSWISVQKVW